MYVGNYNYGVAEYMQSKILCVKLSWKICHSNYKNKFKIFCYLLCAQSSEYLCVIFF